MMLPYSLNPFGINKSGTDFLPDSAVIEIKPYLYQNLEFQIQGLESEFVINWGDGNQETVPDWTFASHTYYTDGVYRITLIGNVLNVIVSLTSSEYIKLLWWDIGCSNLSNAGYNFSGNNLTGTVPETLWIAGKYDTTRAVFNFSGCYNIENYNDIPQAWK